MALTLDDIGLLFERHGHTQYTGEPVTQLEHALQSAALAEAAGAAPGLIVASLLHDLGHMLEPEAQAGQHGHHDTPTLAGIDDLHQYRILPFLRPLFGDEVLTPIALHVDAKRYLCATDAAYFSLLSEDSVRSLQLQGGIFDEVQATAFIARPHAADAVRLRRWDDLAKKEGEATPDYRHFATYFTQCLRA
ncbi:HD domain-containing protein [Herbaspirillum sp. LeCh32-8]|uniref:phosphonate degradation HD-domain oxygenase n=1 Tax=Herbaspirillum sp. LeCh32-8 TaxID=2821356 RepID=UPI001AE23DD8|nr:phosphonate degradation HD-domain oxygenase [Herbaspirillum sp. LeCh32-8]MBP0599881.1 HD domain-containing protein [Herbaspirillum sp. LeCh32-8]